MKLTVIGYWGGYPKTGEASTGYLLQHEGFNLLIDCGSAVLSQLQHYIQPTELDAVIISHYHADHVADIGVLQHAILIGNYLENTNKNLPIYGHSYDPSGFASLTHGTSTTGQAYKGDERLNIGPFQIELIKTKHPVTCFAMRITVNDHTIVYTADTSYFEELVPFSTGADILLCECNFYKGMDGRGAGHMTSEEAGKLANRASVKKLVLTHLPHYGDHQQLVSEAKAEFSGEVLLASQGLSVKC